MKGYKMDKEILVVDTNTAALNLMSSLLQKVGYTCTSCVDSQQALAALDRQKFPLVVADARMPDYNGGRLLHLIRRQHRQAKVIVTSHEEIDRNAFNCLGALDYFNKLQSRDQLVETVQRVERDLRVVRRLPVSIPFLAGSALAQTLNISCDGALFESRRPHRPGTSMELGFISKHQSCNVQAVIVRSVPLQDRHRAAVYFQEPIGAFLQASSQDIL
jgi:CheY-like chemotaxis protein